MSITSTVDAAHARTALANWSVPCASIVVPVLNEAQYIAECLTSLLAQVSDDAVEILVMDGGSTDGTQAIVRALQVKHPCIQLVQESGHIAGAMNLASRIASPERRSWCAPTRTRALPAGLP